MSSRPPLKQLLQREAYYVSADLSLGDLRHFKWQDPPRLIFCAVIRAAVQLPA